MDFSSIGVKKKKRKNNLLQKKLWMKVESKEIKNLLNVLILKICKRVINNWLIEQMIHQVMMNKSMIH